MVVRMSTMLLPTRKTEGHIVDYPHSQSIQIQPAEGQRLDFLLDRLDTVRKMAEDGAPFCSNNNAHGGYRPGSGLVGLQTLVLCSDERDFSEALKLRNRRRQVNA